MKKKILKSVAVAGFCAGCYLLCRVLQVPPLYLSLLSGWGGFCFLFSYELAGSRRRLRNGIEEKTLLHLAWMAAGLVCIVSAVVMLFRWS